MHRAPLCAGLCNYPATLAQPPVTFSPVVSRTQRIAAALLRLWGWRSVLVAPPGPRGIVIVYPHTSNWDFVVGMLYKLGVGFPVHWMGKHTLFRWPIGKLWVQLGGIPVNRRAATGFVEQMLGEFASADWMWLVLAPEGTRSRTDHWKSGFYRIAVAGGFHVGLGYIDYATRTVGVDTYLTLSGDAEGDFARIRAFYADKHGKRPTKASDIRLRD